MPRTLEVYRFLGIADDLIEVGSRFPKHCVYEWPEGRKPVKTFEMLPWAEPTPSVPYVRAFHVTFAASKLISLSGSYTFSMTEESVDDWSSSQRGHSS